MYVLELKYGPAQLHIEIQIDCPSSAVKEARKAMDEYDTPCFHYRVFGIIDGKTMCIRKGKVERGQK